MSSGQGLHQAGGRWRKPLATIKGKYCATCLRQGKREMATCAVLTMRIGAACRPCAQTAKRLGFEVVMPEQEVSDEQAA